MFNSMFVIDYSNQTIVMLYLALINVLSGFVFIYDKLSAGKGRRRIAEKTLHLIELVGGVFSNLILMYLIKHKNRKVSYSIWTWLIAMCWVVVLIYFAK